MNPRFIHLHVRSEYSMVDGLSKIDELIKKALFFKMPALAITDFHNLFGLIKFYDIACNLGIKPIIGADFLVKNRENSEDRPSLLTCLATSKRGYYHLIELVSKSYKNKCNNTVAMIQYSWLMECNEGLILLSGGRDGDIGRFLLQDKKSMIDQCLTFYNKYFSNRYYIELVRTGRKNEELYLKLAVELSIVKGLPVVATNDVRFISQEDFQAHAVRVAIHDKLKFNNIKQSSRYSEQQFMKSEQDMCTLFSDIPEAITNSIEIAYRCNVIIDLGGSFIPKFPTGSISSQDYLIMRAQEGLEDRLSFLFNAAERNIKRLPYDIRLKQELKVINQMGFPSYFLIVMEFIQWAKKNGIPVGPGRGSGASSLVAYSLKITEIDPLQFDLLFERFLNPERVSMPDLDIDFCMEHRDLVIEHVAATYGTESVSQIVTFGTMAARAVIRDVGRVLGHSYVFTNRIAKLIPTEIGITLERALFMEPQLKLLYQNNDDIKLLIDMAKKLEGVIKNVGRHAGGVVIAPTKITDFSPLYYDHDSNFPMTQFDKDDIERIGLIKFDFLGLRTLTVIHRTLQMVNTKRSQNNLAYIDINTISIHDLKSFDTLKKAKTTAIFQLESSGIKKLIQRLKPDCFADLIALVALFRPGPLQSGMVDNFINRKHGDEPISYPDIQWQHQSLQPVLESTYGIILYQEQVMQIAQVLAGYTLGNADILRRAIGKKRPEDMIEQRAIFNSGAKYNGIDSMLSMKIFDLVEKFAGYGFNKSHSVAYALISYQTLWLKTYYPAEFMAAALSSDMDNLDKIMHLIYECRRMKIAVLPPDINKSKYYFYVNEENKIIYGIGAIKGIGRASINVIVKSRSVGGSFQGLFDLCIRINNEIKINYRMIEKLILSGACDVFGISRAELIASLSDTIKKANQYIVSKYNNQLDMFKMDFEKLFFKKDNLLEEKTVPWSNRLLLEKERDALGIYLTDHPTNQYMDIMKFYFSDIISIQDVISKDDKKVICIFGLVISIRTKLSKQGNYIVSCFLEDYFGQLEVVIFSKLINKHQSSLKENNLLFIKGTISFNKTHGYCKLIAQEIQNINDFYKKNARRLSIILQHQQINDDMLNSLYNCLNKNAFGTLPVYFYYQNNTMKIGLHCKKKWYIIPTDQLLTDLRSLVGCESVQLDLN